MKQNSLSCEKYARLNANCDDISYLNFIFKLILTVVHKPYSYCSIEIMARTWYISLVQKNARN